MSMNFSVGKTMSLAAFLPAQDGRNSSLAVGTSTGSVLVSGASEGQQVRIVNSGTDQVYIKFGGSAVVATTAGLPLLPNSVEVFTIPGNLGGAGAGQVYVAGIGAAGGNTIFLCPGDGV